MVLVDIGRGVCFQSLGALLSSHPFWIAMSSPPTLTVTVEPVTDPADLPDLASIFDVATIASTDKFREALMRYVDDPYKETMEHLQAALSAPSEGNPSERHFVFKAVVTVPKHAPEDGKYGKGNPGGKCKIPPKTEIIVGMAHWTIGYINIPKVDLFEQQAASASAVASAPTAETTPIAEPIAVTVETATASKPEPEPFDFNAVCRRPVRNAYISQIRGKKHVCKSYTWP